MKSYEITTKPRDLPVGWRTIDFAWWIQEQNRGNCGPRTHRCQPIPPMARTGRCGSSFSKQLVFSSNALNMCYHQDLLGLRHKMVSACFSWWIMRRSHTPLLIPDASVDRAKSFSPSHLPVHVAYSPGDASRSSPTRPSHWIPLNHQ